jgi:hypothetical protein
MLTNKMIMRCCHFVSQFKPVSLEGIWKLACSDHGCSLLHVIATVGTPYYEMEVAHSVPGLMFLN